MKSILLTAAAAVALVAFGIGGTMTAHAAPLRVSIASANAVVGQPDTLSATLVSPDTGQPLSGINVTFLAHASFGKVNGFVEVGQAATNSQGIASVSYTPRDPGSQAIEVSYVPTTGAPAQTTTTNIDVSGAASQMYVQTAGIHMPGLNSWLIVALLTIIWGTMLGVGVTVIRIARAGQSDAHLARREATAPVQATTSIP